MENNSKSYVLCWSNPPESYIGFELFIKSRKDHINVDVEKLIVGCNLFYQILFLLLLVYSFSMTLVDTLDTLVVLGDLEEFEHAVKLVIKDVQLPDC